MTPPPNIDEQLINQLKQLSPTESPVFEQELFYKLGFQAGARTVTPVASASIKCPSFRSVALTLVASTLVTVIVGWNAYRAGVQQGETVATKSLPAEKPMTSGKENSNEVPADTGKQKTDRLEAYPTQSDRLEAYPTFAWLPLKFSASKQDSMIDDLTSEIKDPLHPKLRVRPLADRPVSKPPTKPARNRSAVTDPWTRNLNSERWLEELL